MKETMTSLRLKTAANDVTREGIVTVAANGIGIEDSQHDISMPGSFVNTLNNDISKMRWFLNHDTRQLLGVVLDGEEKESNLIMRGKINLDKQIGRDILSDYLLFAENGRTLEHSIGVKALRRDPMDKRKVIEWQMREYSTLTAWGANPNTYLVGIKSGTEEQLRDAVSLIREAFKQRGYSDERLKQYDMELNLLLKSLSGGMVVTCPCCGHQFDYDAEKEINFSTEVRDNIVCWLEDQAWSETRAQLQQMKPEVQEAVMSIIDSFKGKRKEDLTEKSILDALAYVRCPNCWSRVYKSDSLLVPASSAEVSDSDVADDAEDKEGAEQIETKAGMSFFASLNKNIHQF